MNGLCYAMLDNRLCSKRLSLSSIRSKMLISYVVYLFMSVIRYDIKIELTKVDPISAICKRSFWDQIEAGPVSKATQFGFG